MLREIDGLEGSGTVKLGGYIHIFRANVLPPTSPSHNPCLSETLVPVLTKETRGYSETPIPISQRTGRHILEEKSGPVFNASWSKGVWSVVFFQDCKIRRGRFKRDRRNRSESVYAIV